MKKVMLILLFLVSVSFVCAHTVSCPGDSKALLTDETECGIYCDIFYSTNCTSVYDTACHRNDIIMNPDATFPCICKCQNKCKYEGGQCCHFGISEIETGTPGCDEGQKCFGKCLENETGLCCENAFCDYNCVPTTCEQCIPPGEPTGNKFFLDPVTKMCRNHCPGCDEFCKDLDFVSVSSPNCDVCQPEYNYGYCRHWTLQCEYGCEGDKEFFFYPWMVAIPKMCGDFGQDGQICYCGKTTTTTISTTTTLVVPEFNPNWFIALIAIGVIAALILRKKY